MKDLYRYILDESQENMMFEMSNLDKYDTGIDLTIWVQTNIEGQLHGKHKTPRIKIRNKDKEWIPISIDKDNPTFLGGCTLEKSKISSKEYKMIVKWIKLNYKTLIDYWNNTITSSRELLNKISRI